jgi:hypothetical protein
MIIFISSYVYQYLYIIISNFFGENIFYLHICITLTPLVKIFVLFSPLIILLAISVRSFVIFETFFKIDFSSHESVTKGHGCQIFLGTTYQNGKNIVPIYQMSIKYSKCPQTIPNGCKIDQMSIKYNQHLTLQYPPKITQIWIFG